MKSVTLVLDGVFFLDGGFAGPDTLQTFDRITADVAAHVAVAKTAREGHHHGFAAAEILKRIEAVTGPDRGSTPPPPPFATMSRDYFLSGSLGKLASEISTMRRNGGDDDQVIYRLMAWTEAALPNFRRLQDA